MSDLNVWHRRVGEREWHRGRPQGPGDYEVGLTMPTDEPEEWEEYSGVLRYDGTEPEELDTLERIEAKIVPQTQGVYDSRTGELLQTIETVNTDAITHEDLFWLIGEVRRLRRVLGEE